MDDITPEVAVHQPDVLTADPERSADELVCEIEYEQAREARLADPDSASARVAAQQAAQRLAEARQARRSS